MVTPTIVGTSLSAAGDGGAGSMPAEAMPTETPVAPAALETPNSSNVARAQTQNQAVQQQQGAQQSQAAPANNAEPVSDSQQSYE